jgi:hypothetical protein
MIEHRSGALEIFQMTILFPLKVVSVVHFMGNPWVFLVIPVPLPIKYPYLHHRYRFFAGIPLVYRR